MRAPLGADFSAALAEKGKARAERAEPENARAFYSRRAKVRKRRALRTNGRRGDESQQIAVWGLLY